MTNGDHYCSYADIQNLLMNAALGTTGNTMYDDTALETALDITMDDIHAELGGIITKVTTAPYVNQLRGIQKDLIMMMILQARHTQQNNLADGGTTMAFWQVAPTFTRDHLRKLRRIRTILSTNHVRVYNTATGDRVV